MNRWLGITFISAIMLFPLGSFPISAAQEFTNSTGTYLQDGDTVTLQTWANGTAYTPPLPPQPPSFVQLDESDYQVSFDLQYLDPMAYTLVESGNTISIINKGVSGVYDMNTCSISIFDADMENELSKESWTVHQAAWGSDSWANMSVNNASCETGFENDNDRATITAVKQNDDGIFVVTYVFDMYGVKTTVSYTNHDQDTFGGIFMGQTYGSPAKFGFVQSFSDMQIDVPALDDGFAMGGKDFTFDQNNEYEYLFLDSTRLLWGINNSVDDIYIDFKNVSQPTQYGSTTTIDPHLTAHPNPPTSLDSAQTELLKIDLDWDAGSDTTEVRDTTYDGTNNGATSGATGIIGDAWDFDGTSDYATFPDFNIGTGAYSWNIWISLDDYSGNKGIISLGCWSGGCSTGALESLVHSGAADYLIGSSGSGTLSSNPTSLSNTDWTMITLTRDSSGNQNWYINGVSKDTNTDTTDPSINDPSNLFYLGRAHPSDSTFNGKIDSFTMWAGKELSQTDIDYLYNTSSGIAFTNSNFPSGAELHFDFEDSTLNNQTTETVNLDDPTGYRIYEVDGITNTVLVSDTGDTVTDYQVTQDSDSAALVVGTTYEFKVSALVYDPGDTPDTHLEYDTSSNWTVVGSACSITGGVGDCYNADSSTDDRLYHNLGSALDNTAWVVTSTLNQYGGNQNGGTAWFWNLSSSTSHPAYSGADAILIYMNTTNGACHIVARGDGVEGHWEWLTASGGVSSCYDRTGGDYWFKVSRTSANSLTFSVYDNEGLTGTPYYTVTTTLSGTYHSGSDITGLQYIHHGTEVGGSSTALTSISFDDFKIYDGVTSINLATTYESDLSDSTSFELQDDLAQPTNLTVQSGLPIELDWDDVSNAVTYNIYRDTFTTAYANTGSSTSAYSDSGASAGVTYEYKVAALGPSPANLLIGPLSSGVSGIGGVSPDPPTSLTATITDSTNSPLDVDLSWTTPGDLGTGTLSGYKIVRDSVVVHTTSGSGTTYTDTLTSTGTFSYTVRAVTNHGDSTDSNSASVTTVNPPSAISDLAATVITDVRIDLAWSEPSTDNPITNYYIFRDSTNIQNTTSTSYSDTGLTSNTSYYYNVFAVSNVGTSSNSNTETKTTYTTVSGSISTQTYVEGVLLVIEPTITISGTPVPNFTEILIYDDGVYHSTVDMNNAECNNNSFNIADCLIYHFDDGNTHSIQIKASDDSHWDQTNMPIVSGIMTLTPDYTPDWDINNVAYNVTRNTSSMELILNRDVPIAWDLTCEFQTTAQAMSKTTGVQKVATNTAFFEITDASANSVSVGDGEHVYVTCMDGDTTIITFTSYGPNLIQGGIGLFDANMQDFLGVEHAAILFVIFAASLFGGRSSSVGILVVLSLIGVLGFVGLMVIDEATWGIIMLCGTCGLFIGKRFL